MILEEETFEAFGYYPRDLTHGSGKPIIAACELCGEFRVTTKYSYRTFCKRCVRKGSNSHCWKGGKTKHTCIQCGKIVYLAEWEVKRSEGTFCDRSCYAKFLKEKTGKNNLKYIERVKCVCQYCNIRFEAEQYQIDHGNGKFCSHKCYAQSLIGKPHSIEHIAKAAAANFKGGRRVALAKNKAKRKRDLGYTLLMPLAEGEVGHHVSNEHVIGIPKDVHQKLCGGGRKKHRTKVLQWLKANDKKKYKMVLLRIS